AKLRVQMRVEIRQLQRRLGTTSLYVTHDQLEALTLADRLVVLNGGMIEQVGTPMEVFNRPATVFVAGFIGSPAMNMLDADWLRARGGMPEGLPGGTTLVGVRPDDLRMEPVEGPSLTLTGQVALLEPAGAESHVYVALDDIAEPLTLRVPGLPTVLEGAAITLHAPLAALHPFDKASGRRLS
ncbi:MAG: TOBE domain-containing protein, partial [Rhodobacteraceae bacterium]|nr:TOBE domain-containing protein [Paracoccaceae bacterium]